MRYSCEFYIDIVNDLLAMFLEQKINDSRVFKATLSGYVNRNLSRHAFLACTSRKNRVKCG